MSDDEDYHYHQQKWEELNEWGMQNPEEWEKDELLNNEELLAEIEAYARFSFLLVVNISNISLFRSSWPASLLLQAVTAFLDLVVNRNYLANTILRHSEREGRELAREEQGDDADEGHDDRIEKLEATAQTVRNRIAYCKGEYSYDDDEQSAEAEQQEEQEDDELEDMDIESDSD